MNIPKVISELGKGGDDRIYAKVGKTVTIKESDKKKELYNIMMDLNLDEKKITFDIIPYYDNSAVEFNYFGNNSAANIQYYAVRDVNSISNFWVGKRSGILKNILDSLPKGELYALLKECYDAGFFNNNGINTEFFVFHDGTSGIKIDCIVKKYFPI